MNYHKRKYLIVLLLITAVFSACKKQWDERSEVADQQLDINVMQQIQANANLSTFAGYLTTLGYDKVLATTKTYTIWAPDNQALQNIDPAIVADTARLRFFVNNHIANLTFLTSKPQPSLTVTMLNNKKLTFTATAIDEATITAANQYVRNGVVHVINRILSPKLSIWEYVRNLNTVGALHKQYLLRQDSTYIDTSKATSTGLDPITGKPILVPGTGLVTINKYLNRVANLANEDSTYTYIVLTDDAYNAERNKVSRFFVTPTNSTDTTMNILAAFNVLKDMAIKGMYKPENLPANLVSVNGVNVPINKAAIVQTYNASNGIVYVMNSVDFRLADKITPIVIEGERPSYFVRNDRRNNIAFRLRIDPNTNQRFNDIMIRGVDLPANFFAAYRLRNLYTCQYKVVWRAVSDIVTNTGVAIPFRQRLTFGQPSRFEIATDLVTIIPSTIVTFPYVTVGLLNHNEVDMPPAPAYTGVPGTISVVNGTLNVLKYSSIVMFAQGDNIAYSAANADRNAMTLDYVKLIPIL
jgi:uncharacterized surface protein with fasciclin (FAS1) repeats